MPLTNGTVTIQVSPVPAAIDLYAFDDAHNASTVLDIPLFAAPPA